MKTKLFSVVPKLASMMVIIHSLLVIVALGMWLLPSDNAAGLGFMLMIIIMYFDYPVEILFWKIIWPNSNLWPNLGGDYLPEMVTTAFWLLFLGGLYWFCIGMICIVIKKILKVITKRWVRASGAGLNK